MTEFNYLGKDTPRPEGADKAAGRAHYIHDITRPGMLYGKIKFSDHAHAKILNIDTSKAEQLPGVHSVITGYNTKEVRIGFLKDNFALKKDKVRQFRDEIAAVAATDPAIAEEAINLIEVEYEPLPGVFSPAEALEEGAAIVHEVNPRGKPMSDNWVKLGFKHESGDLEAGRKAAKYIAEGTFSTQRIQQCCLGTAGCVAEFDMNQNLTVWAKTQIPFLAQRDFNQMLAEIGLRGKNARVIVPSIGGSFGSGLDTHAYEYIAILLAQRTGRPVKIVYTREEEFAYLSPRQSTETKIVQGCDENGKLTFRQIECLLDNGAYTSWGATYPTVMMLPATSMYRVSNVSFDAKLVYTNNTYCQAMRGYGNPELAFALEQNMDELAEMAGIDPFDIRVINSNEAGETTPMGMKVTSCGLKDCLGRVADKLEWRAKKNAPKRNRGIGMASLFHVGGGARIYRSDGCGIMLKLDDFGNVNVFCGGVEMGQGFHSALSLGVAESLGVAPERVFINQTDTATCPWDVGTHASRGAFTSLNAAIGASGKLRDQIFEHAEGIFPKMVAKALRKYQKKNPDYEPPSFDVAKAAKKENFELRESRLYLKDAPKEPWLAVSLDSFARSIHFRDQGHVLCSDYFYDPPNQLPDWSTGKGNMSSTYAFGSQGVEVEVDEETGEVKILRIAAVHDVGKIINAQTLKGQIYGALAQGIGYTLYENIETEAGKILNSNFNDYKIPTIGEMDFPIDLEFIETDDEEGPFGAKGVGEPGLVPTPSAIANAIYDAVGVRIRELPITPMKILAALKEKKAKSL